jgi:hypothetical protein
LITASPLILLLPLLPQAKFVKLFLLFIWQLEFGSVAPLATFDAVALHCSVVLMGNSLQSVGAVAHGDWIHPHITFLLCPAIVALLVGEHRRIRGLTAACT